MNPHAGATCRAVHHGALGALLTVALVVLAPARVARAAQPAKATAAAPGPKERAQALLAEGNTLAGEGDFGAALRKYLAAYRLFPSPKLLLNIGTSLRHNGRNAEAAATYELYLAHPEAQPERIEELKRILGEIDAVIGRLTVEVDEPGVAISLDGKPLGAFTGARTLRVDPGDHTVFAQKPGRRPVMRQVRIEARAHETIRLGLARPTSSPPVVVAQADGTPQRIVAYSIGGAGAAGLVLGVIFGALYLSSASEVDDHCDDVRCDLEGAEALSAAEDQGLVATIALAAGGVALAGGVVIFLTAATDEEPAGEAARAGGCSPATRVTTADCPAVALRIGSMPAGGLGTRLDVRW